VVDRAAKSCTLNIRAIRYVRPVVNAIVRVIPIAKGALREGCYRLVNELYVEEKDLTLGISSVICVTPSRPPRLYNGLTRPVMKQMTLLSQPVLLTQVRKTNFGL
jgi:hypothetical protein